MSDIIASYQYTSDLLKLITEKKAQANFSHKSWSDDDLEPLRKNVRNFYRTQQKGKCAYCKQNVSNISALNCHVEHIAPKSLYLDFIFNPKNLCVICADCNQIKREQETLGTIPATIKNSLIKKYPRSSSAFKIVHPHFDTYEQHIIEINGFYLDRSPKGHFTIGACNLNRKLHIFGWEIDSFNESELCSMMSSFLDEKDILIRMKYLELIKKTLLLN